MLGKASWEVLCATILQLMLKKGLVAVGVTGEAPPPGTEVLAGERPAGRLLSVAGDRGLAHLRFDRASGRLTAGAAEITRIEASG